MARPRGRPKATTAPETAGAARLREYRARPLIQAEQKLNEMLREAREKVRAEADAQEKPV